MQDYSRLVWALGALVVGALMLFLVTGGDLGGTSKVTSDADLPPVTSPPAPDRGTVGSR